MKLRRNEMFKGTSIAKKGKRVRSLFLCGDSRDGYKVPPPKTKAIPPACSMQVEGKLMTIRQLLREIARDLARNGPPKWPVADQPHASPVAQFGPAMSAEDILGAAMDEAAAGAPPPAIAKKKSHKKADDGPQFVYSAVDTARLKYSQALLQQAADPEKLVWVVTRMRGHDVCRSWRDKGYQSMLHERKNQFTATQIESAIRPMVWENPTISTHDLQAGASNVLGGDLQLPNYHRIVDNAKLHLLDEVCGHKDDSYQRMLTWCTEMLELDQDTEIYLNGTQIMGEDLEANAELTYFKYDYVMVIPGWVVRMVRSGTLRKVVVGDAAFMKALGSRPKEGYSFILAAKDADDDAIPLVISHFNGGETRENWSTLLRFARTKLGDEFMNTAPSGDPDILCSVYISDLGKGGLAAANSMIPSSAKRACTWHRAANVTRALGLVAKGAFWSLVRCTQRLHYDQAVERVQHLPTADTKGKSAAEYILSQEDFAHIDKYARIPAIEKHIDTFGIEATQIAESINRHPGTTRSPYSAGYTRFKTPFFHVASMVAHSARKFIELSSKAALMKSVLPPAVWKKVEKEYDKVYERCLSKGVYDDYVAARNAANRGNPAKQLIFSQKRKIANKGIEEHGFGLVTHHRAPSSSGRASARPASATVRSFSTPSRAYDIDFRSRTCACGRFQYFKYPCKHAVLAIWKINHAANRRVMHPEDYVHDLLKTDTLQKMLLAGAPYRYIPERKLHLLSKEHSTYRLLSREAVDGEVKKAPGPAQNKRKSCAIDAMKREGAGAARKTRRLEGAGPGAGAGGRGAGAGAGAGAKRDPINKTK